MEVASATSLRVSWDTIDIPEVTGYVVYYCQTGRRLQTEQESMISVPSSVSSVVIEGLVSNVEYQFQVVAIAELDGDTITGERSMPTKVLVITTQCAGNNAK